MPLLAAETRVLLPETASVIDALCEHLVEHRAAVDKRGEGARLTLPVAGHESPHIGQPALFLGLDAHENARPVLCYLRLSVCSRHSGEMRFSMYSLIVAPHRRSPDVMGFPSVQQAGNVIAAALITCLRSDLAYRMRDVFPGTAFQRVQKLATRCNSLWQIKGFILACRSC